MKLQFAAAASAVLLAAMTAIPAQATPATVVTIGESPAVACAHAADAQSRNRLLDGGRHDALATCDLALNGMLSTANRAATLANRGILEAAANRNDAAIADFNAALARDAGLANVYINRGAALMNAARYSDARADFDQAIRLRASNQVIAYFDRGMANEKSGDVQAAYRDYKMAQSLAPDFEPAKVELARFHVNDRVAANR